MDKLWKTHKLFNDDRTSNLDTYIEGVTDFQKAALKRLRYLKTITLQGEETLIKRGRKSIYTTEDYFNACIETIENLKPN